MTTRLRGMLLAAFMLLPACSGTTALSPSPPVVESPGDRPGVDWSDPNQRITFPVEWTIHACEGDAPLLCVEKDGVPVGIVEAASYPLDSFPDLSGLGDARTTLIAFADGFAESLAEDRRAGCGVEYGFTPIAHRDITLGDTPGMSFGFVGTMPDGSPSELNLQYAAVVGDRIVSIVAAAYDDGGCPGRDDLGSFRSHELNEFRSYLEDVLAATPLPALET